MDMNKRTDMNQRMEEILQSLDGMSKAAPQPWFYTRVKARLQGEEKTGWTAIGSFLARPAVAISGLCLILIINAVLLLEEDGGSAVATNTAQQESQLVTDKDATVASSSSFDYESHVQP